MLLRSKTMSIRLGIAFFQRNLFCCNSNRDYIYFSVDVRSLSSIKVLSCDDPIDRHGSEQLCCSDDCLFFSQRSFSSDQRSKGEFLIHSEMVEITSIALEYFRFSSSAISMRLCVTGCSRTLRRREWILLQRGSGTMHPSVQVMAALRSMCYQELPCHARMCLGLLPPSRLETLPLAHTPSSQPSWQQVHTTYALNYYYSPLNSSFILTLIIHFLNSQLLYI